jgi:phosphatidylinositol alpha-1,6-mannosyltransferase
MTTLVISAVLPPRVGGSGRWLWELYGRLSRGEYLLAAGDDPGQEEFDRTHDRRVVRLPLAFLGAHAGAAPAWGGYWRALRALRQVARLHGIEQVHAGRCLPEGWIALSLRLCQGLPYVCYVHGEEVKREPRGSGGMMASRQYRWITWLVLRGARFLLANSRFTEHVLRKEWHLPGKRIRLLHPGVDTTRFGPAARSDEARARLGWGSRPVVLTVGRLQKRKGHDQMIRALGRIRESVPDILYVVVGDGEQRPTLERLVEQEGLGEYVQFLGQLADDDLVRCYQQCDLFVLPNRQIGTDVEGFGIVLLEAQSCGKPVVAGASGGTAETMQVPETGRLVSCDRPGELAELVVELLADRELLGRMGLAARRWAVERFDWNVVSPQAERLFAEAHRADRSMVQ